MDTSDSASLIHLLRSLRTEVNSTFMPELQSPRAQTIAGQVDVVLRHAITRLDARAKIVRHLDEDASDQESLAAVENEARMIERELAYEERLANPELPTGKEVTCERLADFLCSRLPQLRDLEVEEVKPVLGGFSKDTFLATYRWRGGSQGIAVRRADQFGAVRSSMADEFQVLTALYHSGVAVPKPMFVETRPEVLGDAFIVSEKRPGVVVSHAGGLKVGAEQAHAAYGLAEVLGKLHSLDPAKLDLPEALRGFATRAEAVRAYVHRWEAVWERDRLEPSPIIRFALEWLKANVPTDDGSLHVLHGDPGLHNLLIDGTSVSGMLDWELAHIGEATEDLVYCREWIDKVMDWSEFLRHYRAHGGVEFESSKQPFYKLLSQIVATVTSVSALAGFWNNPQPRIKSMFAGIQYVRYFQLRLAETIKSLV